ncbi:MAG: hypothetical protein H0U76_13930 [Ktedonobacteraceae bacterium]|nr:hypothetical protein [Ktedonobacteraceae bacterium]
MATTPENGPPIHDPGYWDAFDATFDQQLDHFRGKTFAEFTESDRTELLAFVTQQIADMHVLLRTVALEQPSMPPVSPEQPKRVPRARKSKDVVAAE